MYATRIFPSFSMAACRIVLSVAIVSGIVPAVVCENRLFLVVEQDDFCRG